MADDPQDPGLAGDGLGVPTTHSRQDYSNIPAVTDEESALEKNPPRSRWRSDLMPLKSGPAAREEIEQARSSIREGDYAAAEERLSKLLERQTWTVGRIATSAAAASSYVPTPISVLVGAAAKGIGASWKLTEGSARSVLGTALEHLEKRAAAAKSFEQAVALFREVGNENLSPTDWSDYGIALMGAGHTEDAFTILCDVVEKGGATPEAQVALGLAFSARGSLDQAKRRLEAAVDLLPLDGKARLALAAILERLNQPGEAARVYGEAGHALLAGARLENAVQAFDRAIELGTPAADVLAARGETLRQLDRADEALIDLRHALDLDGDLPEVRVSMAMVLDSQGNHEAALAELDEALRRNPRYALAVGVRGTILSSIGRLEEARRDLAAALDIDPMIAWVQVELAEVLRLLGHHEEALHAADSALALAPDDVRALGLKAVALLKLDREAEALITIERALELSPEYPFGQALKGELLLFKGDYEQASVILERAVELDPSLVWARSDLAESLRLLNRFQEAVDVADAAVAIAPDDVRTLGTLGAALSSLGDSERALAALDRALNLAPMYLFGLTIKAGILLDRGQAVEAAPLLKQALELDPDDENVLTMLVELWELGQGDAASEILEQVTLARPASAIAAARIFQRHNHHQEAIDLAARTLDRHPDADTASAAWAVQGWAHQALDNHEVAVHDFSKAVELDPENAQALWGKGESLRLTGRFEEACEILYQALRLDPGEAGILQSTGYALIGLERYAEAISTLDQAVTLARTANRLADLAFAYLCADKYDLALAVANEAVELESTNRWALRIRGRIRIDFAEFESAIEDLQQIVEQDSSDAEAYLLLGWAFSNLLRPHDARVAFAAAWHAEDDNLWARAGLADALLKLGERHEARQHYEEIVRIAEEDALGGSDTFALTGWCCYRMGHFNDAILLLRKALAAQPDVALHFDLALVFFCSGEPRLAAHEYERALSQAVSVHYRRRRGYLHVALLDLHEALQEYPDLAGDEITTFESKMSRALDEYRTG